jgi:hypothetical protein
MAACPPALRRTKTRPAVASPDLGANSIDLARARGTRLDSHNVLQKKGLHGFDIGGCIRDDAEDRWDTPGQAN